LQECDEVGCGPRHCYLTGLSKNVHAVRGSSHGVENGNWIAALAYLVPRERERNGEGTREIKSEGGADSMHELIAAWWAQLLGEGGASIRFKHRHVPVRHAGR